MSAQLLEAAAAIGALLCREAYWSGKRCSWVGRALQESQHGDVPTVRPIGVDLYGGTAGVGLFLAELWAATGEAHTRRAAMGALEQARAQADRISSPARLGLYSGAVGIGLALVRGGELLGDEAFPVAGTALICRTCAAATGEEPLDLISGSAGAIQTLLAVEAVGAKRAIELAERLVAAGIRGEATLAWPTARATGKDLGPQPLTGLSHGTAGMGLALLEVAARTGRADLREAGEAAFRYEDKLFSAQQQNWPDLRTFDSPVTAAAQPSYSIAWCHGAPGIGLARLRALQLFPGAERWLADVLAAVQTTRRRVVQLLSDSACDTTPCHGIAGLLELLLMASPAFRDLHLEAEVVEAWRVLVSLHAAGCTWPSGFPSGGKSPSLMLGLAGVGHALLRAASPGTVRSVLLVSNCT